MHIEELLKELKEIEESLDKLIERFTKSETILKEVLHEQEETRKTNELILKELRILNENISKLIENKTEEHVVSNNKSEEQNVVADNKSKEQNVVADNKNKYTKITPEIFDEIFGSIPDGKTEEMNNETMNTLDNSGTEQIFDKMFEQLPSDVINPTNTPKRENNMGNTLDSIINNLNSKMQDNKPTFTPIGTNIFDEFEKTDTQPKTYKYPPQNQPTQEFRNYAPKYGQDDLKTYKYPPQNQPFQEFNNYSQIHQKPYKEFSFKYDTYSKLLTIVCHNDNSTLLIVKGSKAYDMIVNKLTTENRVLSSLTDEEILVYLYQVFSEELATGVNIRGYGEPFKYKTKVPNTDFGITPMYPQTQNVVDGFSYTNSPVYQYQYQNNIGLFQ